MMRDLINLVERQNLTGLASVTPEQVIAYCRDPRNSDVHPVYVEQIETAFDDSQEALDEWVIGMVDIVKAKVAQQVGNLTYMYRGFQTEPTEPLGVHWTTSRAIADMFAQGGVVLTARIDPNIVDWLGTIVRGIFWDNDREDELFLIERSEVTLIDGHGRIRLAEV